MGESPKVSAKQTAPSSSGRSSYDVLLAAASVELSPAERKTIQVLSENNDETVRGLASILRKVRMTSRPAEVRMATSKWFLGTMENRAAEARKNADEFAGKTKQACKEASALLSELHFSKKLEVEAAIQHIRDKAKYAGFYDGVCFACLNAAQIICSEMQSKPR